MYTHVPIDARVGPFATGEYGPRNIMKLGKFATPTPMYDDGSFAHASCRLRALRPRMGKRGMKEVLKPVAQMMASKLCRSPVESMQPVSKKDVTPDLMTRTLGFLRAWGCQ